MKIKTNTYTILAVLIIGVFLMSSGLTRTDEYILNAVSINKLTPRWNINISYPKFKEELDNFSVNIDNTRIIMDFKMDEVGKKYSFETSIENKGTYSAILSNIDFNNYYIGQSELTGNSYYLKDYIALDLVYAKSNKINDITVGDKVINGSKLVKGTSNLIKVELKVKNDISDDALGVLNSYKGKDKTRVILNLDYQELKK